MATIFMAMALMQAAPRPAAPPAAAPAAPAANPGDTILNPAPSPDEQALGRELAANGTLAALLPLMTAKETEELLAAHLDLTAAEQARLRAIAEATAEAGTARLLDTLGHAYAMRLSAADMRAIAAFNRTPAARNSRAITPFAIGATVQAMGAIDFKGETLAAFCKETGKGCVG